MSAQLRKYGTSCTIFFPLIKVSSNNFAVSGDYTHATGDVKISKDGGAAATATNAPSAVTMGNGAMWSLTLTAAEMQAAEIVVTIIDAATKAVEDQMIIIHTFGNASAMVVADLSAANLAANAAQIGGQTVTAGSAITAYAHIGTSSASTAQTGDSYARLGAPANASISADVAAVKTDTGNLVSRITSTLFSGITSLAQWLGLLAGKQTGNTTARTEVRSTGAGSGTYDETTDSLEAARDNVGTAGAALTSVGDTRLAYLDAAVSTRSTYAGADTSGTTTLLSRMSAARAGYLDNLSGGAVMLASSYTSPPSAASNASAVRTELAVELARIDAATSSRLAASTYVSPPSAASISAQVTSDLATAHGSGSWATATGFCTLDAAGIRTAVGLASANLDTQLGDLPTASEIATQVDTTLTTSHGDGPWGPGSSGAGAYTLTITVDDGTDPLEGAKVRLTEAHRGVTTLTATTNASGVATFAVDAATWAVAITKAGHSFTPTSLVVSGTTSHTYSMTASGPTPSTDPDKTTVRVTCYGADTLPEPSAVVSIRQLTIPSGDESHAFNGEWTEYTADADGVIDLTCWSDATYAIRRDNGDVRQFTPTGASDSVSSFVSR